MPKWKDVERKPPKAWLLAQVFVSAPAGTETEFRIAVLLQWAKSCAIPGKWLNLSDLAEMSQCENSNFSKPSAFK
jgi:hypothetical protein